MADNMADGDEINEISPQQTEKLLQFQDLTGIEDMDRCREILSTHNWDMEVAVQHRFSEQEGRASVFEERREPRTPQVDLNPRDQRIFTITRRRPQGIMGWGYFILLFPFRFVYHTFLDIFRFAFRLLRPDPRRYVTDPLGDVRTFIEEYEQLYGPLHPDFKQSTYSQALNQAKQELKFLLVYLHSDEHQDTESFCRNTLCNPDVAEFINSNMVFWACNTKSPEGYRVSQALRENTYPFLALVVLRDNRMTVVAKIEGPIESEELVTRLGRCMEDNEASLVAARAEREERSFNQSLREEQDQAYLESLRQDQEKERRKREEEERRQKEVDEALEKEMEAKRKLEEIARRKEELRDEIPSEPDSDDPSAIKLLLKLPNGIRLERRFLKSQSLKHLYNYVFVHEAAPDDFDIITNFPRKTIPCQPTDEVPEPPSFESIGLGKSEMLFVHDNEA